MQEKLENVASFLFWFYLWQVSSKLKIARSTKKRLDFLHILEKTLGLISETDGHDMAIFLYVFCQFIFFFFPFSPDGEFLYSHGVGGQVYIWDLKAQQCVHKFVDDGCNKGTALAVSRNNR